ncbi:histidine phosphatase family protein [Pseudomonas syringae pv. tagetis]|uniref:Histidine phosphatase family protein n=2 Tax=Pseudomonas syringae group genomosp. 7 TaxID=251699 RepID=A0A0Q0B2F2_9PSED|nr:histidine phosphatase family protein [Pseudomonas syringae group genomosp. 7]KPX45849.1 Phosphoglycerate/bisphosphoglycerate mutase [Pseudomonas syringae pv. helianthi]KPY84625.1 Phosphoglycerate/bisphosphoglycerate mutase [Pseudomonas syringae pv. tagetis]RMR09393.1 Phosphoglycerate/bisphosphoglycerate mutase [Pseudomonas syringae pv. helianthi]RMV52295.1 Phosphoglycerate/bisphosphoglycerate mutase [Pseudomonas syringae pv. helianthi]RMW09360.1 Phosphoglycerate/bisphosphoglycerate mutase [
MGSIYLIRHGQASFGADNYDVLSPVGIRQSQVLGAHLAQLGLTFDRCVSGELMRQKDTAQHVLGQYTEAGLEAPPLQMDSAFDEFDAEGVIRALIPAMLGDEPQALDILRDVVGNPAGFQRLFNLITKRWLSGSHDTPGLQSWQGFVAGVEAGLKRILQTAGPHERIAVFTSGGTITALLHLVTGMPALNALALHWHIVNTSLHRLKFKGNDVTLASFNGYTHLQLLKTPELITYR